MIKHLVTSYIKQHFHTWSLSLLTHLYVYFLLYHIYCTCFLPVTHNLLQSLLPLSLSLSLWVPCQLLQLYKYDKSKSCKNSSSTMVMVNQIIHLGVGIEKQSDVIPSSVLCSPRRQWLEFIHSRSQKWRRRCNKRNRSRNMWIQTRTKVNF